MKRACSSGSSSGNRNDFRSPSSTSRRVSAIAPDPRRRRLRCDPRHTGAGARGCYSDGQGAARRVLARTRRKPDERRSTRTSPPGTELAAGAMVRGVVRQAGARLVGPGGYYNAGNALGLAAGIAVAISALPEGGVGRRRRPRRDPRLPRRRSGGAGADRRDGDLLLERRVPTTAPGRTASPPIEALNRRGDFLSGIGALILGVALLSLGQPVLAVTAGPPARARQVRQRPPLAPDARLAAATGRTSTARSSSRAASRRSSRRSSASSTSSPPAPPARRRAPG